MYSAVAKSREKCFQNNPGVGSNFASTKLTSETRGALTLGALSALLLITSALAHAQIETVLYGFCAQSGCADGYHPRAGLVLDTNGNLYGTTRDGGANAMGTVFEVSPNGTETVLYSFCSQSGCTDGYHPLAGLILDKKGNLYGTTFDGGAHDGGTVFEISPGGTETVLYSFCAQPGCKDGYYPHADLVMDTSGNLYGTTQFNGAYGGGTVFRVSPSGAETVLHSFCAQPGCADGYHPRAGLVLDTSGNLYGTTYDGGTNGKGTVFEVSPGGTETVLHSFCPQLGCKDGSHPQAGLVLDAKGNLYGTTYFGGKGRGTVFEVSPSGTETVLHNFTANGIDGYYPSAGLVLDGKGNLYGTTLSGGANVGGTVFQVVP
jgi:uncharacterized repeat protein (TIGR03803 family)